MTVEVVNVMTSIVTSVAIPDSALANHGEKLENFNGT